MRYMCENLNVEFYLAIDLVNTVAGCYKAFLFTPPNRVVMRKGVVDKVLLLFVSGYNTILADDGRGQEEGCLVESRFLGLGNALPIVSEFEAFDLLVNIRKGCMNILGVDNVFDGLQVVYNKWRPYSQGENYVLDSVVLYVQTCLRPRQP